MLQLPWGSILNSSRSECDRVHTGNATIDLAWSGRLCWRMGCGEDYLTAASRFYGTLNGDAKAHYDAYFPEPKAWVAHWR